jgi:UDP-glucose 4-epimerase
MRILVTGGCGYVGSHASLALARLGHHVAVIDDLSLGRVDNLQDGLAQEVPIFQIDVEDTAAVAHAIAETKADVVVHLAALHFIPACEQDPQRAIRVNVGGTQGVLAAAARAASVRGVVVASTAAVYAPSDQAHSESSLVGPTDIYGHTKLWTEQLGELFRRNSGKSIGIARLFNVFGPGETNPHLIPTIVRQLQDGEELRLGNLLTKRDYVYVEDVARGLVALCGSVAADRSLTCNLGTGRQYSGNEVVGLIGRLMGREVELVTDETRIRPSDRPSLLSDSTFARDALGWVASTSLEEGLMQTVARPLAAGMTFR